MIVRSLLVGPVVLLAIVASPAAAKKYTLPQLIEMSRNNPQLQATAAATSAMQAQVLEAKLNWLPTGNVPGLPKGFTAPGTKAPVGQTRAADKQKSRDKRKAEKAARKKNRR